MDGEREQVPAWIELLRQLLDEHDPLELLNNRAARSLMRRFVEDGGQMTRPDIAIQAFVFGAAIERERVRAWLLLGTWAVHDEPWDEAPAPAEG